MTVLRALAAARQNLAVLLLLLAGLAWPAYTGRRRHEPIPQARPRNAALDVFKGVAILWIILNHTVYFSSTTPVPDALNRLLLLSK